MKTLLSILAAVTVFGIAVPANAAHRFLHERRIVGYNPMGFPIYQWVTVPAGPVYGRPYGPPGHWNHGHFGHDHGLHRGWYKH